MCWRSVCVQAGGERGRPRLARYAEHEEADLESHIEHIARKRAKAHSHEKEAEEVQLRTNEVARASKHASARQGVRRVGRYLHARTKSKPPVPVLGRARSTHASESTPAKVALMPGRRKRGERDHETHALEAREHGKPHTWSACECSGH